jgi:hypothetical protein
MQEIGYRSRLEDLARQIGARGCTEAEVAAVAADQGLRLPSSYRVFLQLMGKHRGALMSDTVVGYPEIIGLRDTVETLVDEHSEPHALPNDAVVFALHQGYEFWFLRSTEGPDPAVWFWTPKQEDTSTATIVAMSLPELLEAERRHPQIDGWT